MKRIVIIDHDSHTLYVEDVNEELLAEKYNGEEEDYIKDTYSISDNFSWDYIISAQYIPNCTKTEEVYDIDFDNIKD